MRIFFVFFSMSMLISSTGCALPGHVRTRLLTHEAFVGPRVVAVIGNESNVVRALEDALRTRGFRVKRQYVRASEEAPPRYVLEVSSSTMVRCFGGGFRLHSISAELIDVARNESVYSAEASGYTENCEPLSGNIFGNIAEALKANWRDAPERPGDVTL